MRLIPDETRLTSRDQEHLAVISTDLRLPAATTIYRQGEVAQYVFLVRAGGVSSSNYSLDGQRRVLAFLFEQDVFGLARHGCYVNTATTITRSLVMRLPVEELLAMLPSHPRLQIHLLCKTTHALRRSQRHTLLMAARDPTVRVARFLDMLEGRLPHEKDAPVALPMTQTDIGDYLNLPQDTVDAALQLLERQRLIRRSRPNQFEVINRRSFQTFIGPAQ